MNPNIEIPFDRKKIIEFFIGCLLFVAAGLWLGLHAKDFEAFYFGPEISPLFVKIVALSTLLFYGVGLGLAIKLFLCKQPAMSMDDRGITFHLKLLTNGPIPWEKIAEIKPKKILFERDLCFYASDPKGFINQNKGWRKIALWTNYKLCSAILSVNASLLACTFSSLEKNVVTQFEIYNPKQL